MLAFFRVAYLVLLWTAVGCGQSADASGDNPAASPATEPTAPVPPVEPKPQPVTAPVNDAPTEPAAKIATGMCPNKSRWSLTARYALTDCKNALQDGCDETLGVVIASVERSLSTSPERLRRAGSTMADLLGVMGDQVDNMVLKPADAMLKEIKAYAPTDAEKEVHTTLVADYDKFIALSKRWSEALHKYNGDVGALADLQTATEKAETKVMVHGVQHVSLCDGTAK